MRERGAVLALTARKRGEEPANARAKINRQAEDGAQLDHDGVHLPERIVQREAEELFRDAQVRRGADRQKFREAFNNAQKNREQIFVQNSSVDYLRSASAL